jgi:hypothetical protein
MPHAGTMTETEAVAREFGSVHAVERVYVERLGEGVGVWIVLSPFTMDNQRQVFKVEREVSRRFRHLQLEFNLLEPEEADRTSDFSRTSLSYRKSA